MDFINTHLLSLILFLPTLVALVIFFLPKDEMKFIRWTALIGSLFPLALSLVLWLNFRFDIGGFQFQEQYSWYEAINSTFHLGVDGLSLTMVLFTTLLTPLAILASFSITDRVRAYMMLFLFLETGMLGVFMALDLLIFFVFWEVGLVPMYFLINQWGSANRNYASLKFMIYTMGGSLGLLLAVQMLGVTFGTYDLPRLYELWPAAESGLAEHWDRQNNCFLGLRNRFRGQSPLVAVPYLATRCTYRSTDRWFDDLGGRALEAGCLWLLAPDPALLSGAGPILCWRVGLPGNSSNCLRCICLLWPDRLQALGGILVGQSHGICGAGHRGGG